MAFLRKIKGFCYFTVLRIKCRKYPEEGHLVSVNGVDLHYFTRGDLTGLPVVLLHGNGGSHRSMRTQAMELALKGYRIYSPDSRGQGENEPLSQYHYADMMEDTFRFISALGLKRPALFGWSDGGIIELLLEMAHPGTSSLIVVAGANLCPDCGPDFESFKEWILSEGTPLAMMMLSEPDINPSDLQAIKCPALVTVGGNDLISVEHTRLISDNIPDAELEIFEGESHGSYIKKSPKIGRSILGFFNRKGYVNRPECTQGCLRDCTPEHGTKPTE